RRRRQALLLQTGEQEGIDGSADVDLAVAQLKDGWPLRRLEGPVLAPLRPLVDPAPQRLDLLLRELLVGLRRRHEGDVLAPEDAPDQFALGALAGHDDGAALAEGAVGGVEAEFRLAGPGVGAVTLEAIVR